MAPVPRTPTAPHLSSYSNEGARTDDLEEGWSVLEGDDGASPVDARFEEVVVGASNEFGAPVLLDFIEFAPVARGRVRRRLGREVPHANRLVQERPLLRPTPQEAKTAAH